MGNIKNVLNVTVAVLTSALEVSQTETKGTVVIKNAE